MTNHLPARRSQKRSDARSRWGRAWLAASLFVLICATWAPAAKAQWTVIDPAHIAKTIWNGKKLVDQITNQKRQIEHEIAMLKKLPNPPWRAITAKMVELDEVMRAGEALAYSMDNLLGEFGVTFPGFQNYANWSVEKRRQFDRQLDTYANVMMSLQKQGQHVQESQEELQHIKDAIGESQGQTSAIELGNTIGTFTAEELMLIRQLLAAQANAQAVHNAYQVNREAQEMAARQAFYDGLATQPRQTGKTYSGVNEPDN